MAHGGLRRRQVTRSSGAAEELLLPQQNLHETVKARWRRLPLTKQHTPGIVAQPLPGGGAESVQLGGAKPLKRSAPLKEVRATPVALPLLRATGADAEVPRSPAVA